MLYNITHTTVYRYDEPVPLAHHLLRLRPRAHPRQRCETCDIMVDPRPTIRADHDDHFGNHTTFVTVEGGHRELTVTARSRVELLPPEDYLTASLWGRPPACRFPEPLAPWTKSSEFTFDSPLIKTVPMYADYAGSCFPAGRPLIEGAMDLTGRIYRDFQFDPEATTISTPVDEVFKNRRGVCQDFAHLEIACLRSLGIPARYVSGYIETTPPSGQAAPGRSRRLARLDFGLLRRRRMGRFRPHQQRHPFNPSYHCRLGARLQRCQPHPRRDSRQRRPFPARRRRCCARNVITFLPIQSVTAKQGKAHTKTQRHEEDWV